MKSLGRPGPRPAAPADRPLAMPLARHRRRRRFSTLTLRILAPNVLALALLVGGIFYLDQYRDGLLDAKIAALQTQAEVIAGALGESALTGEVEDRRLDREIAARIIRRLVVPTGTRARLYDRRGGMLADSRELIAAGRHVQLRYLPPADAGDRLLAWFHRAYDWLLPRGQGFPPYRERPGRGLEDFPELTTALGGEVGGAIRAVPGANLILGVAVPVQPLRQVVGALLLSADDSDIEDGVRNARLAILQATALALTATVLLSIFLAGTIAGPVRRLAAAADRVRRWRGRRARIPDLGQRHDEIGDLSVALHEMTEALYARLDAIEVFAADVAHEIKNPLTSLRSALESIRRTDDIQQKARLLAVMEEDVQRLDRLISDISNASRVDAELARADSEPVDLAELLRTLVQVQQSRTTCEGIGLELQLADEGLAVVEGVPGRLGQVVDNLVGNARSFSPPGTTIRLALDLADGMARLRIDDDGRGIPAGREEAIFQRFYSQRPDDEAFGRHSGLGLSICRQIVEAHGGTVEAENRQSPDGEILGARFTVRLPLR